MWSSSGNAMKTTASMLIVRYFSSQSRKRAPNLRKINPRVPYQEAAHIAEGLYGVIKSHGPVTIGSAWNHAKDAGISGLVSKTHLKLMLKWMRGRNMLKQIWHQVGSSKKFFLRTLPEDPLQNTPNFYEEHKPKSKKRSKSSKL